MIWMKTIEKQIKKGNVGIALFLILMVASIISGIYIYSQMQYYLNSIFLFMYSITYYIIFIALFFSLALIHELNHWLSAHSFGIKNKYLGLSPIFFFVNPLLHNNKKYKKSIIALAGPSYTIFESFILVAFIILLANIFIHPFFAFNLFAFAYFPILFEILFVSVFMNGINLLPVFKGDDGYISLKYFNSNKTMDILIISMSAIIYIATILFIGLSFSAIFIITSFAVLSFIFYRYGSKIFGFKLIRKKGWHPIKLSKYTIGYYYKWE